ncbi:hypothetical protein FOCC_FOCC017063 [Frankliniella occidentalis]|nr:hypothetical protein FOCC_FOCC017063 [Frankliniella occidentalis]
MPPRCRATRSLYRRCDPLCRLQFSLRQLTVTSVIRGYVLAHWSGQQAPARPARLLAPAEKKTLPLPSAALLTTPLDSDAAWEREAVHQRGLAAEDLASCGLASTNRISTLLLNQMEAIPLNSRTRESFDNIIYLIVSCHSSDFLTSLSWIVV